jgi:hypothetical protein
MLDPIKDSSIQPNWTTATVVFDIRKFCKTFVVGMCLLLALAKKLILPPPVSSVGFQL